MRTGRPRQLSSIRETMTFNYCASFQGAVYY